MTIILSTMMATNAKAANYNINCYDYSCDWYEGLWVDYSSPNYDSFNGWNIILKGRGGEKVIVCILDMDNLGELVDGRTYTEADIITDWSGVTFYGQMEDLNQETGIAYTQTHDEEGKVHVNIEMLGYSGNTYHVTYDESCQMIGDMQELTFTDEQVTLLNNTAAPSIRNFQIIAEIPGEMSMMIAVNSDKLEGEYTIKDVIQDFSDITWGDVNNGEYSVLKFCDVDMKVTEDPELPGAYYYDITAITKVGWGYHTVLHSKPWEKPDVIITETKTITASNLRMMDYREAWGELLFIASSPEYSLNLYAYSKETQGTFGRDAIDFDYNYVWYYENGVEKQATAIDGEYTYTEDANGNRSLTGWIDCTNGVKYILDLHYNHADVTRTVTLDLTDAVLDDQRGPDGGGIIIESSTAEQYILIAIYTPEIEGVYTEQDMDWQTTYIVEFNNEKHDDYMLELLDANVVVTDSGDHENYNVEARLTMQAEMDKSDVVEYIIHMTAYDPKGAEAGISNIAAEQPKAKVKKILRNGRVILVNGNDIYNAEGARIK